MSARRPWLLPLVPLYAAGASWKSRAFAAHPERARRLQWPVISVGSLSAGGAGKTPFVIALGEAIRRAGYGIDVLTRGHGRASTTTVRVQADGDPEEFGDEPLLLAKQLACPVYVARERFDAGQMAETDRRHAREDKHFTVHLLDDGFQHRQLARAVDIVLFTVEDARDMLLPAGNLREPFRALRRADAIVLRDDEAKTLTPVLARIFHGQSMPPVWTIERRFAFVDGTPSARPLAFCGIARPGGFLASLDEAHVTPAAFVPLRDHTRYDDARIASLGARARAAKADGFVTTAKDAVKLSAAMRRTLAAVGPLATGDISVRLRDEQRCVAELIGRIEAGWRRL